MKKFINFKKIERIIPIFVAIFTLIFTIIAFSIELTNEYKGDSIFTAAIISNGYDNNYFFILFVVIFVLSALLGMGTNILYFFKKKKIFIFLSQILYIILFIFVLIINMVYEMLQPASIVLFILLFIVSLLYFVYLILFDYINKEHQQEVEDKNIVLYKKIILGISIISVFITSLILFLPFYSTTENKKNITYYLIGTLGNKEYSIYVYIFFVLFLVAVISNVLYLVSCITSYFISKKEFIHKAKNNIFIGTVISLVYFLSSYFLCFYLKINQNSASTMSYIPFIMMLILYISFSIFLGKLNVDIEQKQKEIREKKKIEPLLLLAGLTVITFLSLIFNIISVKVESSFVYRNIVLSGYKLLKTYENLESGYQMVAFVEFFILLTSLILFAISVISYFSKSNDYNKIIKISSLLNLIFMFLLALFGFYFKIVEKINEENIKSLLEYYGVAFEPEYFNYKISSQMIYLFIASLLVYSIMIVRGHFNYNNALSSTDTLSMAPSNNVIDTPVKLDFDACPAFTELDMKISSYKSDLETKRQKLFDNLTLPSLVRFIVDYARECRLHLSYEVEDIATFVAGLGASRLSILQGMSGTGKTSLPKIFAEAVLGNCEIVEVESSWRDKNELLGYYNEFSKCFTPKKFTQCLYKAKLNPEIITFIVLDEMNLSRIEYYFSDFLSLMENEEHLRKIKLLNVKLHRTTNGNINEYYGLSEGHTIDIPINVWFIGTANRDESTFEISDKVYDRAQTMNFNKRAPKISSFTEPLDQRFITYDMIAKLFIDAKNNFIFDAENSDIIKEVEKILQPYNISFGNRILRQMEDFVKIYCCCFGDGKAVLKEAIENILLSKVVTKLETKIVENKEELAAEFEKIGLNKCSAFVRKLNED